MAKRDIAVVGGGLTGYATAVALALAGFDTVLVAPDALQDDGRSTALIGASVGFLSGLGLADVLAAKGEPLTVMRLVDDMGRLLRAPTVEYRAEEIGLAAFGTNILNADLLAALRAVAAPLASRLTIATSPARDLQAGTDDIRIELENGSAFTTFLAIGADGRNSLVRKRSGIALREWSYPQSAIVLNVSHRLDHGGVSTEFHTRTGPFTQVPLPGRKSSIVWVETPDAASLLVDLKAERLIRILEDKMHSILGAVDLAGPLQAFPLKGASAQGLTAPRIALVGEAAHVFPPIGAQGLNLGLRDAAAIVAAASASRDDPGSRAALARYEGGRRADVLVRSIGVDLLNRSLLAAFLPTQAARTFGLSAMAAVPFLRRFAMREGVAPGAGFRGLPRSLRNPTSASDADFSGGAR